MNTMNEPQSNDDGQYEYGISAADSAAARQKLRNLMGLRLGQAVSNLMTLREIDSATLVKSVPSLGLSEENVDSLVAGKLTGFSIEVIFELGLALGGSFDFSSESIFEEDEEGEEGEGEEDEDDDDVETIALGGNSSRVKDLRSDDNDEDDEDEDEDEDEDDDE